MVDIGTATRIGGGTTRSDSGTMTTITNRIVRCYHGKVDGIAGPETQKPTRWFQSNDKIPITAREEGPNSESVTDQSIPSARN